MNRNTKRTVIFALMVFALAIVLYANNLGHDWAYDDHEYITENEYVNEPGHIGDIFSTTYLYGVNRFQTALYRPVTVLSYAVNRAMTGLNPGAFHLVNDIIHAANSTLVFLLLSLLTGSVTIPFAAAALFAAHPIHTEAVNNVVGRAELLAFFFALLALVFRALRERGKAIYYPLALFSFFLALMCKETPAILPFVIVLVMVGELVRGEKRLTARDNIEAGGWFGVLAVYIVIRHAVIASCGDVAEIMMHDNPLAGLGFFERLPTALAIIVDYTRLLVFPLRLSADYSYNQIPVIQSLMSFRVFVGLAVTAVVIVTGFLAARRSSVLLFGVFMLALPYAVVSNIVFPIGTIMGERLMYLPSFGFVVVLAWGIERMAQMTGKPRNIVVAAVAVVTVLYGVRTLARNPDWKNNETIFAKTAETSPNSVKTAYNYALVLKNNGRTADAIDWYRRAIDIWPEHYSAWFNLGNTLRETGQTDKAIEAYRRAHELVPEDPEPLHNLALTYKSAGMTEKAVETFETIHALRPGDPTVLMNIGATWAEAEEYDRAMGVFREIVASDPKNAGAIVNMGNIYVIQGDTLMAETLFQKSLDIDPGNPSAHNAVLGLLIARGLYDEAERKVLAMQERRIPVRRLFVNKIEQHRKNERSTR